MKVNFLDLLDVLIRAPESPKRAEKLEDINLLFINMHHLINEFRWAHLLQSDSKAWIIFVRFKIFLDFAVQKQSATKERTKAESIHAFKFNSPRYT